MKFLDRLERTLTPFAIPHLTMLLIAGQVAVYMADVAMGAQDEGVGTVVERLMLVGPLVWAGEVWRVITFMFIPSSFGPNGILVNIISWLFFYFVGTVMENTWGTFRYNAYIFVGVLATVAAALLWPPYIGTNTYLYATVFLAFARLYPDHIINLFYVLPIKAKWLALMGWLGIAVALISVKPMRLVILASIANYLLFFWKEHYRDFQQKRRRAAFEAKTAPHGKPVKMVHICGVCGRSSADEPKTQFRYCSQCDGQKCYCPDHIREHEHVVAEPAKR
ncbi:rhomboid family intramembrane serine protease [Aeoliella sp. SH292]|uniref:rhomboid family intramembrane serine protease n=1 Tax=Aeoliella sp. SH292 TaxID=3454464 RepID=UPI003F9DDFCA